MDNISIKGVVGKLRLLKFPFGGVWSADNFPRMNSGPRFQIVSTSPKKFKGTQLQSTFKSSAKQKRNKKLTNIVFWNSLKIPLNFFTHFQERFNSLYKISVRFDIHETASSPPPQSLSSNLCGLYCLYAALQIFQKVGYTQHTKFRDRLTATKHFRFLVLNAVKNIGLINELNLMRFFSSISQTNYTLNIL